MPQEKKWKRLVAWFLSYRAKSVADAERNFSRKTQCFYVATVNFNVSVYYLVTQMYTCSCKEAAWKSTKTVGKDSGCESGSLHCVYGQETTVDGLEPGKIVFF